MIYNVFGGTLNLAQSILSYIYATDGHYLNHDVGVFRALEADSRSLHSLSSQHRRLSPCCSDQAVVGTGGLSRGDSMTSLVSGASLGSVTGTAQGDDCESTFHDYMCCTGYKDVTELMTEVKKTRILATVKKAMHQLSLPPSVGW